MLALTIFADACLCQSLVEAKDDRDSAKEDPLLNRIAKILIDKRPLSSEVRAFLRTRELLDNQRSSGSSGSRSTCLQFLRSSVHR